MTSKSIQAWVIHKQWSGDTSARVTFFTRELGLVQCLCKGGRTPKKQSLLQAFTPIWLAVEERYDRYFAKSIESISPMLPLVGTTLFSGLYLNELIYHALRPIDAMPELFDAYLETLNGLLASAGNQTQIESFLRRFEWALLQACGHSFSLTEDARTGADISAEGFYVFVAGEGLIAGSRGIPGEHILALAEDNLQDVACLKSAKIIMRQAVDHLLGGREIKARGLYMK